jgi:alpha-tubulin suppressor-like RCC1 family protein
MCTRRYDFALLILVSGLCTACRDDPATAPDHVTDPPDLATSAAPAFDFISAGDLHTCAIALDDRAWCWGWNVFGQVGDGSTTERLRPVLVKGGLHVSQVDAGWYQTCAVATDSKTYCWGKLPAAMATALKFRQVAIGSEHSCGVTMANKAYCWGTNRFGELGNGTWEPLSDAPQFPIAVRGNHLFREVTVSVYHSCGVTLDDKAYCWGGDGGGELGDGSASGDCGGAPCRTVPTLVAGGRSWRRLEAGGGYGAGEGGEGGDDGGHTCGVTMDHRAFCWGAGKHGQNGDGNLMMRKAPVEVAGGLSWRSVSLGVWHACGLTTDGKPWCWGYNFIGQLGDGTLMQRNTPKAVAGGHSFRTLSAGGAHTCALTAGGVAWCWGSTGIGDGTDMIRKSPVRVVGPT